MNIVDSSGPSGAPVRSTTARAEWWGLFGAVAWMFLVMNGWDMFMNNDLTGTTSNTPHQALFKIVFAFSLIVFGLIFGNRPDSLSKAAFYLTPVAIVITAVFALFPRPVASVLYICSSVLFAPALMRRSYGVFRTSEEGGLKYTRYVSCVIFCLLVYVLWVFVKPPKEAAYIIPALLALPGWIGIRRLAPLPGAPPGLLMKQNPSETRVNIFGLSKKLFLLLAATIVVLFWLNLMSLVLRSFLVDRGYARSENLLLVLGLILPPLGFIIFAYLSDRGLEWIGIICGTGLLLVSVIMYILPDSAIERVLLPLALINGIGGSYYQYFSITIPLYFYKEAKRPLLVTSLGVVFLSINSFLEWQSDAFLPEAFRKIGSPLLASMGISAVIFIIMVSFIFRHCREMTLAAALNTLLHSGAGGRKPQNMLNAGLTHDEVNIALLLIEGKTRSEITRSLHLTAVEADLLIGSIRGKIINSGDPDPVIAAAVTAYKLTHRETDMLRCLRRRMTNDEIASELFLSGETVKFHVRNLLNKLNITTRKDLSLWEVSFKTNSGIL